MTHEKALEVLQYHEEWRKGSDNPQTNPQELSEALEVAIKLLKEELGYCDKQMK